MANLYEFRIKGQFDRNWSDWFDQLAVSTDGDETVLRGPVKDQAELYGILVTLRDLGLALVSVQPVSTSTVDQNSIQSLEGSWNDNLKGANGA